MTNWTREFTNTGIFCRQLILKREKISSPVWLLSLVLFAAGLASAMQEVLGTTAAELYVFAVAFDNPAMVAMMGALPSVMNYGSVFSFMLLIWTAMTVAVMNIMFVIKHTRADEELGRYEVLRSLPIGRMSTLNATMLGAIGLNAVLAVLTGLGIFVAGDSSMTLWPSMLWGLYLGVTGYAFAAIAALFAQLSQNSRGAKAYAFAALGVFYLLRAIGDMGTPVLSLINPLGVFSWADLFVSNHVWPLLISLGMGIATHLLAFRLSAVRDIDQGFIPAKKGRDQGKIKTPLALALALQKTSIIWWVVTVFVFAASYASIFGDIDSFIEGNELYAQLVMIADGFTPTQLFAGMVLNMLAVFTAIPVIQFVFKAQSEEKHGRSELIFATPVKRTTYLAGYFGIAWVSTVIFQVVTVLGMYVTAVGLGPEIAEQLPLGELFVAGLVYLPGLWVLLGLATCLLGFAPKLTGLTWIMLVFTFLMVMFGRLFNLPTFVENLSPMANIPQVPVESINWGTLGLLTAVAVGLSVAGFVGYARRETR